MNKNQNGSLPGEETQNKTRKTQETIVVTTHQKHPLQQLKVNLSINCIDFKQVDHNCFLGLTVDNYLKVHAYIM